MVILEFAFIFIIGAMGYGSIETLWRGHTHWTMLLLGGICLYLMYLVANKMKDKIWKKLILCASIVTTLEFIAGCIVNLNLGWEIWDYSDMKYNLLGQICPVFSMLWLLLSIPCIQFCRLIYRYIFSKISRR